MSNPPRNLASAADSTGSMVGSHAINGAIHRAAVHVTLIADVLFSSRLYRLADAPMLQPVLLGLCAAIVSAYFLFALLRGYVAPAVLTVGALALVLCQLFVFSGISGISANLNSAFQFSWLFTFIVFFLVVRDGHGDFLARTLLFYASIYAIVYAGLAVAFHAGVRSDAFSSIIAEDQERGERIYSYVIASAYAWFCWLQRFLVRRRFVDLFMLILCALSIGLALSRVVTLLALFLTLCLLLRLHLQTVSRLSIIGFGLLASTTLAGVFIADWNPFGLFAGDSSGAFRIWEYDIARNLVREHPLTGIGVAPTPTDAWTLVGQDYFAASDLGALGVWFDLGLMGILAFIGFAFIACRPGHDLPGGWRTPLVLTGCLVATYGGLAPVMLYPAGATYFAVLLGFWFNAGASEI